MPINHASERSENSFATESVQQRTLAITPDFIAGNSHNFVSYCQNNIAQEGIWEIKLSNVDWLLFSPRTWLAYQGALEC